MKNVASNDTVGADRFLEELAKVAQVPKQKLERMLFQVQHRSKETAKRRTRSRRDQRRVVLPGADNSE